MQLALQQVFTDLDGWQVLAVIVKAMTYGATFVAAGGVMFIALFAGRVSVQQHRLFWRVVTAAAWIGMVLSILRIGIMNGMMTGELSGIFDATILGLVLQSKEGLATILRLVGLLFVALFGCRPLSRWRTRITLLAAVLAVLSFAFVGHAGEALVKIGPTLLPQILLSLHLLAVAFWLGALWPLHRLTYDNDIAEIAAVMHRFGDLAGAVVSILIVVGALLLWMIVGTLDAMWSSAYGQLFIVKLSCFVLLIALAAMNKLRLTTRLLNGDTSAVKNLRFSIKAEMTLAALILLTTAIFTTVVGPVEMK